MSSGRMPEVPGQGRRRPAIPLGGKRLPAQEEKRTTAPDRRRAADRAPDRAPDRTPAPRTESRRGSPAEQPARSPELVPQLHEPGGFPLDPSAPNREQAWHLLGQGVQDKLREKAGTILAWWARVENDGRPVAMVFGPHGLCRATPVVRDGRQVHLVERMKLEPGAMRQESFTTGRSRGWSSAVSRAFRRTDDDRPQSEPPPRTPPPAVQALNLTREAADVLGNFPADVQSFLQQPFLRGDPRVVADWYYEETLEFAHQHVFVIFCLSADRNVTLASATRTLPRGASLERAQWQIDCYHAPARHM